MSWVGSDHEKCTAALRLMRDLINAPIVVKQSRATLSFYHLLQVLKLCVSSAIIKGNGFMSTDNGHKHSVLAAAAYRDMMFLH